ncbi:MAG TPA: hypothetical protein VLY46_03545 [Usitatibacter sp.]|nr:hypothetical protein [Usitatibacter sp.]
MKILHRALAALAAAAALAMPAYATTYSVDYTDLWYNPNESGWGLNLIQQGQTMFGTLFVYGVGTTAQWFVASDIEPVGTSTTQFSGQLFQTSGPYFAAPGFDPNQVRPVTVGTIGLTFTDANTAILIYTVNGQQVTKTVTRQTWRNDNLSGTYIGGLTAIGSSCNPSDYAGAILIFGELTAAQSSNNQVTMNVQFTSSANQASQCTYQGPYTQAGRSGSISGTYACNINGQSANAGSFTVSRIQSSLDGFMGHFNGQDQYCASYDGQFGGVLDVPLP